MSKAYGRTDTHTQVGQNMSKMNDGSAMRPSWWIKRPSRDSLNLDTKQ